MVAKLKLFSIIGLYLFIAAFKQDAPKPLFVLRSNCDNFITDNIGNLYLLKADEIKKYGSTGELLKVYSNKKLGRITFCDASNVLRILVFYKDFAQIIFLDSQLSQNGETISLENMGLEQCDLASTSFNNGIWLYNRQNAELLRLDASLNKVVSTGNLNRLLNTELHPNFLMEYNGFVYLNNPSEGILVFDIYGTYSKTIQLKNLKSFQVKENGIYYFDQGKFRFSDLKLKDEIYKTIADSNMVQVKMGKMGMYVQYADSIVVWAHQQKQ